MTRADSKHMQSDKTETTSLGTQRDNTWTAKTQHTKEDTIDKTWEMCLINSHTRYCSLFIAVKSLKKLGKLGAWLSLETYKVSWVHFNDYLTNKF